MDTMDDEEINVRPEFDDIVAPGEPGDIVVAAEASSDLAVPSEEGDIDVRAPSADEDTEIIVPGVP